MGAILLLEWTAADPQRREQVRERLSALALLESAQLLFAATDTASVEPAGSVVAIGFATVGRAETALARWQAEGALPAEGQARIMAAEAATSTEAPILLFP